MTREQKISLIVGFALVLLVAVAVSDHLSKARDAELDPGLTADGSQWGSPAPARALPEPVPIDAFAAAPEHRSATQSDARSGAPGRTRPSARGPIATSLDHAAATRPTDFLTRLRDRFEAMPLAAETDRAPTTTPPGSPKPVRTSRRASTDQAPVLWHSVVEGESLWSIAQQQYGDGALAGKLAAYNGARASNPNLLRVGVRLRIPPKRVLTGEAPTAQTRPTPRATPQPKTHEPKKKVRRYTIKPGDTLGEIAMRELGTVRRLNEIVTLNPKTLADPDIVPVGVTILLPVK